MRSLHHTPRRLLAAPLALLLAASCGETSTPLAPGEALLSGAPGGRVMFNPQPEPPRELFRFMIDTPELVDNPELIDNPNLVDNPELRPWAGSYGRPGGREEDVLAIEHLRAQKHGWALHLVQRWSLGSGDSALPAVQLTGVLNLRTGRLVLSGAGPGGGTVHVQGSLSGGTIGGELMFNPQPDPPMPQRSR